MWILKVGPGAYIIPSEFDKAAAKASRSFLSQSERFDTNKSSGADFGTYSIKSEFDVPKVSSSGVFRYSSSRFVEAKNKVL